jgi:hypothetical protein
MVSARVVHRAWGKKSLCWKCGSAIVQEPQRGIDLVGEEIRRDDPAAELRLVRLPHSQSVDRVAANFSWRFREDTSGDSAIMFHDQRLGVSQVWRDGPSENQRDFGFETDDASNESEHGMRGRNWRADCSAASRESARRSTAVTGKRAAW